MLLLDIFHNFLHTKISYGQDWHGSPCSCFLQDVKTFACSASPKWNNGQMKWYCLWDYDKLYGLEATPTHYYSEGRCHFKEIEHNISHLSSFISARIKQKIFANWFKIFQYDNYPRQNSNSENSFMISSPKYLHANRKNGLDQLSSLIAFCIPANWGPFATLIAYKEKNNLWEKRPDVALK